MGHRHLVAAVVIAACSHPPRAPKQRVAREPDDTREGAVLVPLVNGAGLYRGQLDGPASDTIDWVVVDRPAPGGFSLALRSASADVWLRAFDGPEEIAVGHAPRANDAVLFQVAAAPARMWIEISDLEREAGSYELAIDFVPRTEEPAAPVDAAVSDAPLRYCAVGEVSDECRRAPPCNWTKIDPANPRCAPEQRPR